MLIARRCCISANPAAPGVAQQDPVGRNYYVRLDTNDYSIGPGAIGRMVDVAADLDRVWVRVRVDGRVIADHARVCALGMTVANPPHVEAAARLRKQFQQPRAVAAADAGDEDLLWDLCDYDRAFGLGEEIS